MARSIPSLLPTPSLIDRNTKTKASFCHEVLPLKKTNSVNFRCNATSKYWYSDIGFDLYDLLGVDSSSEQPQIKAAYRRLQKRCHPDIAGPPGHDMAIVLNEAYKVLSTPSLRSAYDKEQELLSGFRGYTGKPLYSVWHGTESERRAIFVDEVKCVGCLKCALFAERTFAVESVHGRARVVAQWADPEDKIQAAIDSCPVDCISMVDRSDLAALEFLMSKQPRGNVRVGAENAAGARVSNIFVDVKKFKERTSEITSNPLQESHRQAMTSISNWLYWQPPKVKSAAGALRRLPSGVHKPSDSEMDKIREAAAAMKQATKNDEHASNNLLREEYWVPITYAIPQSTSKTTASRTPPQTRKMKDHRNDEREYNRKNPIRMGFPSVLAICAVVFIRIHAVETPLAVGVEEHIGGSVAVELVNSYWLQDALAATTWYFFGDVIMNFIEMLGRDV